MQVQHETHLIEGLVPLKAQDFAPKPNETLESYTLNQTSCPSAIERLVSSPAGNLIAAFISGTNQIIIIDTKTRTRRERFPLKSCDKKFSKQSFTLKGFDFSPDGTRLAVGQTDCIIYIYKLSTTATSTGTSGTANSNAAAGSPLNNIGPNNNNNNNNNNDQNPPLKPTITGKFVCSSPITCLIWTEWGIVFGTQDGKVKLISISIRAIQDGQSSSLSASTTSAKVNTIYSPPQQSKGAAVPIALAFKSPSVIAIGFVDGNVLLLVPSPLDTSQQLINDSSLAASGPLGQDQSSAMAPTRRNSSISSTINNFTITHTCPPYYLAFLHTNVICLAGSDGKIAFHSTQFFDSNYHHNHKLENKTPPEGSGVGGGKGSSSFMQTIELKEDLLAWDYSPINEVMAMVTSSNKLSFIKYNQELRSWQLQGSHIELINSQSPPLPLTSVIWTRDGSQLLVGTMAGSLELFRCSWSKETVGDQLDICHIAKNRVRITDRARNLLATYRTQYDIKKVNLLDNGQSVIIWTSNSLLLARLGQTGQQSEISWGRADRIGLKFCFDHPGFVIVSKSSNAATAASVGANDRHLFVVKLGQDKIIYSVKLELNALRSTISVRQYPSTINRFSLLPEATDKQQRSSPGSAKSRHSSISAAATTIEAGGSQQDAASQLPIPISSVNEQPTGPAMVDQNLATSSESLNERLAFLIDPNQLVVVDLKTNARELIKHHTEPIVWLEFSHTSNSLVFRDSSIRLYLLKLANKQSNNIDHEFKLLVDNCEFANWLPGSDILIAQSSFKISIWYNIDELNKVIILDSRSYNINCAPPIIDLSFAASQNRKPYLTIAKIDPDYQLVLSNGQTVPLDRIKVKFYTEIVGQRLESALGVLERETSLGGHMKTVASGNGNTSGGSNLELWSRLGWLAVEQVNLQVAIKAFGWIGHSSMVKYLEKCLAKPEELEWRLALVRGDWATFEQVAEQQQIVSTYKRLNKWTLLIDYLNRKQQFRQRDLAESDYRQWLLDRGRYLEGAKIQVKNGDLLGAIELLVHHGRFSEAADLFVAEEKVSLARAHDKSTKLDASLMELARKLCSNLIELREFHRAATLCDKILGEFSEALDLYLQGESYERAVELAKMVAPDRVGRIEESYGDHLLKQFRANKRSRRQTYEAIDKFLASGRLLKALDTSIELRNFTRAYEVFQLVKEAEASGWGDSAEESAETFKQSLRVNSRPIAEHLFRELGGGDEDELNRSRAVEVLLTGGHYEQVLEYYISVGDFKKAFTISLNHLNDKDRDKTVNQFEKMAKQMESDNCSEAEQIYLMLDKPELAIEMHKRLRNFDRMLELVAEFSADSLEPTLLLLARELESEGQYGLAEQYSLRASQAEWTNVVRMYQLAGKWEDAYRVARLNCGSERDPLLIQLAYWWAKSLVVVGGASNNNNNNNPNHKQAELAHDLLKRKLNLLNQVMEFCCENRNFQFALDLCQCDDEQQEAGASPSARLKDMVRRHAAHLEEQHKFDRAEEVLLRYDMVEEAARMYLDNDQHLEAIRVVESKLVNNDNNNNNDNNGVGSKPDKHGSTRQQQQHHEQLVELLNRILVLCADRLVAGMTIKQQLISGQMGAEDGERLLAAQQLYLRAQQPELAVNLYRERGLWKEAIQVAQRFAPQLLESLEGDLDAEVARDVGPIVAQVDAERRKLAAAANEPKQSNPNQVATAINQLAPRSISTKNFKGQLQQQQVVAKNNISSNNNNFVGPDYLKLQAESSMRNGDLNGTKTALGKFLDSLIESGGT